MKAYIRSIGSYAPQRVMHNEELAKKVDTSDEWIYTHTGIRNRHIAADDQATSDLAYEACLQALEATKHDGGKPISAGDIDLILCATASPDYNGFPSTACLVQNKLGAKRAGAMDLSAACTGFIYALETAKNFVNAGSAKHILVIGAEIFSRIVNWKDRGTCVLFGDGAGAALVSARDESDSKADPKLADSSAIGSSYLASDGAGAEHLIIPAGGTKLALSADTPDEERYVRMNGRQVYVFAVHAIIETVEELLRRNSLSFDQIDFVVPHQANRRIIEASCKRAGWSEEKFVMNMEEYANTSAASIPLAMDEIYRNGRLKRGMRILTIGFGGGLTYGGNLFTW